MAGHTPALAIRVRELGLDTSHHTGSGWARGQTKELHPSIRRTADAQTQPDDEVFVENSRTINNGRRLIKRLLARGWPYRCALCGIADWQGKPLVLHLDHINGVNNDNRLPNLRLLCPNCHSQTETYCKRTRSSSSRAGEPRACYTSTSSRAWRNW